MKSVLIGLAGLALASFVATAPAQAQGVPPGSYLQSCNDVHMERDRLVVDLAPREWAGRTSGSSP